MSRASHEESTGFRYEKRALEFRTLEITETVARTGA